MALILRSLNVAGAITMSVVEVPVPPGPPQSPPPPAATEYWGSYIRNTYDNSMMIIDNNIYTFSETPTDPPETVFTSVDSFSNVITGKTFNYNNLGTSYASASAHDHVGGIYTIHYLSQTGFLPEGQLSYSTVVSKFNQILEPIWTVQLAAIDNLEFNVVNVEFSTSFALYIIGTVIEAGAFQTRIFKISTGGGSITWSKKISFDPSVYPTQALFDTQLKVDSNGDLILAGSIVRDGTADYRQIVMKITSDGVLVWSKEFEFPTPGNQPANAIIELDENDNIFVSGGHTHTTQTGYIYKLDSDGDMMWVYDVIETNFIRSIKYFGGAIYLVSNNVNDKVVNVLKIDSDDASIIWNNTYTAATTDYLLISRMDADTGYFTLFGSTETIFGENYYSQSLLMRQNADGSADDFELDGNDFIVGPGSLELVPVAIISVLSDYTPVIDDFDSTDGSLTLVVTEEYVPSVGVGESIVTVPVEILPIVEYFEGAAGPLNERPVAEPGDGDWVVQGLLSSELDGTSGLFAPYDGDVLHHNGRVSLYPNPADGTPLTPDMRQFEFIFRTGPTFKPASLTMLFNLELTFGSTFFQVYAQHIPGELTTSFWGGSDVYPFPFTVNTEYTVEVKFFDAYFAVYVNGDEVFTEAFDRGTEGLSLAKWSYHSGTLLELTFLGDAPLLPG